MILCLYIYTMGHIHCVPGGQHTKENNDCCFNNAPICSNHSELVWDSCMHAMQCIVFSSKHINRHTPGVVLLSSQALDMSTDVLSTATCWTYQKQHQQQCLRMITSPFSNTSQKWPSFYPICERLLLWKWDRERSNSCLLLRQNSSKNGEERQG